MAKPPRRAAPPRKVSDRSGRSAAAAKTHAEPPDAERASSSNSGRRSTYQDAVAIYEQAVRTLQQHNYAKAADLLRHVITTFPQERELLERSRLYLALCDRHLRPTTAEPVNTQERPIFRWRSLYLPPPSSACRSRAGSASPRSWPISSPAR